MLKTIILFTLLAYLHSAYVDITAGPPPYDKPWVAGWGYIQSDPNFWNKRHEYMLNQTRDHKEQIKIVFLGDSKTEGWIHTGIDIWNQYYPKRGAFNYGINGDSTRQIIWRIENGELDGLKPKVLVFMIGGNNFNNNYNRGTDVEIVKAYHVIMQNIKHKLPEIKVILIGQLPRGSHEQDVRAKNINTILKKEFPITDVWAHFLDVYDKYLESNTTLQNKSLYISDEIHLNKQGYQLLAQNIEPLLNNLLEN